MHTRFLKVESRQIRSSPGRNEQNLTSRFLSACRDDGRFALFARRCGASPDKSDPFTFENLLHQLANVGAFFGQQAVGDDCNLATQPLISLRNLSTDRPTADHNHRSGQALVVEDTLIGKIRNAIEAIDWWNIRPGPCCNQEMLRPECLVTYDNRFFVGEPRGAEVNVHSFLAQRFGCGGFVYLLNRRVEIFVHLGHVGYRRLRHDSVLRSCAHMVRNLGHFQ